MRLYVCTYYMAEHLSNDHACPRTSSSYSCIGWVSTVRASSVKALEPVARLQSCYINVSLGFGFGIYGHTPEPDLFRLSKSDSGGSERQHGVAPSSNRKFPSHTS